MKNLAVIGAGSWGTALAIVLARRFERVRLWVYETDLCARMASSRENDVYLQGFTLPENVQTTSDLAIALDDAEIVLSVMPSHLVRALYGQMLEYLHPSQLFVSATKGITIFFSFAYSPGAMKRHTWYITNGADSRRPPISETFR